MELNLIEYENDIQYQIPQVRFPAFETYKAQAEEISAYIRSLPVTEDSIKDVRATLAKARKLTDRLNRSRIDIKKEILSGYDQFEAQVKELCDIVGEADKELRKKVDLLDEMERKEKLSAIEEIWDKRIAQYDRIQKLWPYCFDLFFKEQYLNKTYSMKKIESEMADWMEDTLSDIRTAEGLGEDYLYEYSVTCDLNQAIQNVKARRAWEAERTEDNDDDPLAEPMATFTVIGEKDIKLAEMLLKENDINYMKGN